MPDTSTLRARFALARVNDLDGRAPGQYVSYVKALPATILRSGLGQAMAIEAMGKAKEGVTGSGHARLYEDMERWLLGVAPESWSESPLRAFAQAPRNANRANLILQAIIAASEDDHVRVQAEALAYLDWLKKFAVAFLEKSAASGGAAATGGA